MILSYDYFLLIFKPAMQHLLHTRPSNFHNFYRHYLIMKIEIRNRFNNKKHDRLQEYNEMKNKRN